MPVLQEFEPCDVYRTFAGPWLFGVSLDVLLFGILTVQIYMYFLAFPKDRRLLKLGVTWVYLVGAAQTILAMVDLNSAFNGTSGDTCNLFGLGVSSHFWLTVTAFSAAVALTAQWLFAYRIYVISRKRWILILVICLSLGQLGTSIVGSLGCLQGDALSVLEVGNIQGGICAFAFGWVWGPLNFLCDATITVSMSILLLKRRNGTLKKTTHAHITRVVQSIVETGLVTSVVVLIYTVTYNLASTFSLRLESVWIIPGLTMGKVYSNSMLALLNSRLTITGGRNTADPFGISEIRSEVLRTEVGGDRTTGAVRTPNEECPESA